LFNLWIAGRKENSVIPGQTRGERTSPPGGELREGQMQPPGGTLRKIPYGERGELPRKEGEEKKIPPFIERPRKSSFATKKRLPDSEARGGGEREIKR